MLNKLRSFTQDLAPEKLKIASNTGWLLLSKINRVIVGLLVGTWVARYLGPHDFGVLEYAIAFSSFFLPLSTVQMSPVITKQLVRNFDHADKILGTAFSVQLMGGIIAFFAATVVVIFVGFRDEYSHLLILLVSLKFIFNSFQPIENWFEASVNSKFVVFASNIAFLFIILSRIGLIYSHAPLFWFALIVGGEGLIYSLGLIYFYNRDRQRSIFEWRTSFNRIQNLLKEVLPLCLSSTAIMVYSSIDQVMLGKLFEPEVVGIYASAIRLSSPWSFLPTIICSSLYPSIIAAKNLPKTLYFQRIQKIYDLLGILAYIIILGLIPISSWLIQVFYGLQFISATPIFIIHIWINLFVFQGIAQSRWIVSEGLQIYNFYAKISGLIINIFLNFMLIPFYQGWGAAIATLISAAYSNYIFFFLPKPTRTSAWLITKSLFLPLRFAGRIASKFKRV